MLNFRKYSNNVSEIVIPDNVTLANDNFSGRFSDMKMLTSVVIPNRITNISSAYSNCTNLIKQPKCSDNVIDMSNAFNGCTNLNGAIEIGANVINASRAFYNCPNIEANCYVYSQNLNNAWYLFDGASSPKKKVIWYNYKATTTKNTIHDYLGTKCQGSSCVMTPPKIDRKTGLYQGYVSNVYAVSSRIMENGVRRNVSTNVAAEREKNGD